MSEPFIAEIRIFAGNFAPRSWAFCEGQLLPVSQNTALFSLIGTTYGGDGRSTTALPNLQGRSPMHPGRGPGLTARLLGQKGGLETVDLSEAQMPNHNHQLRATNEVAESSQAENKSLSTASAGIYANATPNVNMAPAMLESSGGGQAHNNMMPYLTLNFIIALQGLFPSRS
ncbi:tail fiber protein [Marinilongibacter aquaticus]|uniref:phage tail protein n=1 Tax=Marinilongibacter aquaticus TaxID=2975157 RepID=UPI0021BDBE89|nr:tail fiber protein [Marinilongibacter aquaticus]UBM59615.1 tail fiber protein [Marinilongibacter aquaticus]